MSNSRGATNPSAIVIGAGIVGICCALSLMERGIAVCLVDRDEPGRGASFGNAGVISPWSCVPQSLPGVWKSVPKWLLDPLGPVSIHPASLLRVLPWAWRFFRAGAPDRVRAVSEAMHRLNRPSLDLYRHHLDGTGHELLICDSYYVHVFRRGTEARLSDLSWQLRIEKGADLELISARELADLEPDLARQYEAAIIVKGQGRTTSPGRLCQVLADKVRAMGCEFRRAGISAIMRQETGWRVVGDGFDRTAGNVVIAAGAWSSRLLAPLGIRVPMQPERGYHVVFREPGVELHNSVMDVDAKFVASSMESGIRSAGTAEFADLEVEPNFRRATVLARHSKRMLPGLNTDAVEEWMGIRPSFPDSIPALGEIPGLPGLLAAFGHSHYGLVMAPMTGRIISGLLDGNPPNMDLSPYRIDRFAA